MDDCVALFVVFVCADMVSFIQVSSEVNEVNEGDACILHLPPLDSYPVPSMQWYEGSPTSSRPVSAETQRLHVTLDHRLVILETARTDDNKRFSMKAINSYALGDSSQTTYSFTLQVNG